VPADSVAGVYGRLWDVGEAIAGELMVFLRNSVYAVGGVIGVFMTSSRLLRASNCPMTGVRGSSDGNGEKGLLFPDPRTKPWPFVMRGDGRAGMVVVVVVYL
jgi:hypothetical protein